MSSVVANITARAAAGVLPHIVARAGGHSHSHNSVDVEGELNCGANTEGVDSLMGLRIASIFVILIGSTGGAVFPVLAKRSKWLHVPKAVFDFAKYFGSGVIIATAFIHLLASGLEAFESECLSEAWHEYPYGIALCMLAIFSLFLIELVAFRWGTAKLAKLGKQHDAHGHHMGSHAAHGPEGNLVESTKTELSSSPSSDIESVKIPHQHGLVGFDDSAITQVVGIAILEFGVALHSILIGLTLAVDEQFKVIFVVLVFHQTFEGLGIGSRLAYMRLPPKYNWVPLVGAISYGLTTPIGIAVGLGVRSTYNPGSTTASIVSGVMDSVSAGILIYTGLVELLAHEFLFNKEMMNGSNGKLAYAIGCMLLGCALMALLGKWA
ncbi:ZIP-like iron-zinc transporter [Crucibulum laeve]|uniref:ZIP-like iron-zinc transporter n=1 Tax=Crucibulum laeve TaxID=68775 RepID=A0A5C3MFH8_9AGAR|nr:ZIP-like iron-zinc transporter [Crucibulum laeve]